jgi:hypothetical protein
MSKTTAMQRRAESKLAEIPLDQRAELLQAAGIGDAGQARALGAAFRMLEKAVHAEDQIRVGSGRTGRMLSRPNWEARISASRTLLEWLAPVVKRSVNAGPSGRTVVNVVTAPYAGQTRAEAHAVVIDVDAKQLDEDAR